MTLLFMVELWNRTILSDLMSKFGYEVVRMRMRVTRILWGWRLGLIEWEDVIWERLWVVFDVFVWNWGLEIAVIPIYSSRVQQKQQPQKWLRIQS